MLGFGCGLPDPPPAPYPPSQIVEAIGFDWSTHVRRAPGSDNWPLTWAADGHQYTSWGDGGGFGGTDSEHRVSLGFGRIEGSARNFIAVNVWGDPENSESPARFGGKTYAMVSVDGQLLFWNAPGSNVSNLNYQRLYRSTDGGNSWMETGAEWTRERDGIGLFTVLQFGRDHRLAPDGYLYLYATEIQEYSWEVQIPGELALLRVPVTSVDDVSAYEYFAGLDDNGAPTWGSSEAREPVFEDPNGLMRNSAIYNPCLDRYFLVTNHSARNEGNLGIFEAPEPWGPWSAVLYEAAWPRGGEVDRNTFYGNFSPKWSWNGSAKDFVFVFTGKEGNDSWNSVHGQLDLTPDAVDHCAPDPE